MLEGTNLAVPLTGKIVDIGLGGLCASFPGAALAAGSRFYLEFRVPLAVAALRVLAKVRYAVEGRHGFQFLNITAEQRDLIRRACQGLPII